MSTFSQGRRVSSIKEITQPGDYFGPTDELNAADEVIANGVWFLLPIANPADPFDRWMNKYDRNRSDEENRAIYLMNRMNGLHRVTQPPWTFTEHPDGSLEIVGSIASGRGDPEGEYFHGFLRAGHKWEIL